VEAHCHAPPDSLDSVTALSRWKARLGTLTARGFTSPPFARLVLGPVVRVDLDGNPTEELHDATIAWFVENGSP
jgi:hypothetical protein